jgi:NADH-quinone oxidoreductase subunit L
MNKIVDLIWLIPVLPLIGFLINGLGRKHLSKVMAGIVGSGTVLASFVVSLLVFLEVRNGTSATVKLFDLINIESLHIGFSFQADALSSLFLLIITGVGFLIHWYSTAYMHEEEPKDFARYFAWLNLFVFSMLLLVMGSNFIIMFIGWEGVGLCSYLLIGYWFKNNDYNNAAKKAFVMNRIGDLGFLLAIFWLIAKTGTAEYSEVFTAASLAKLGTVDVLAITLLLFVGATGKSAQIPLFTWLPDAMAGPTPVSALIHAATMVTAGIYMIARSNALFSLDAAETTRHIIAAIGLATAILAATIAVKQNDIKKVLAYSTVSQLGFMFLALGVGAYTAAVFHVMTHAFFKALMFLGSGSVIHAMGGEQDITKMGGLGKKMKTTYITFFIGCLAIAGCPLFSGFFSKDAILLHVYEHSVVLYVLAVAAAMLTAYYMFRLLFLTFTGSFRGTHEQEHHLHESPATMTIPLVILAVLSIVGGFVGIPEIFMHGGDRIKEFLAPVLVSEKAPAHPVSHSVEIALMAIATIGALLAAILAYVLNKKPSDAPAAGLGKVLQNKWYVDELYSAIIAKPLQKLSSFFNGVVERSGIDGLVNGVGRAVNYSGRQLRLLQSGNTGNYILLMVVGIIVLLVVQLFV